MQKRDLVFNKRIKIRFIIFAVLSAAVLAFIFFNSSRTPDESNGMSIGVMDAILRLMDPNGVLDHRIVHIIVRKSAHFIEYAVYGGCLCGMAAAWHDGTRRFYASLTLLTAILSAVVDEIIQGFFARTSSPVDVLLDFTGSAAGVCVMYLISRAISKRKKSNEKQTE